MLAYLGPIVGDLISNVKYNKWRPGCDRDLVVRPYYEPSKKEVMSSIVYIEDKGGSSMRLRKEGDILNPPSFPENIILDVPKLRLREDDVLITGWMRSGTHWIWELVSMMVNRTPETIPKKKERHMFEFEPISGLDQLPSPRILNTHLLFRYLPEDLKTKHIKVIFLLRDPRDAALSLYNLHLQHSPFEYSGKWEDWLPAALEGKFDWGSCFDHLRKWENDFEFHPNLDVHIVQFEKMIKNPLDESRQISTFLGYDIDETLLYQIVDKCQLEKMRQNKAKYELSIDGDMHYKKGKVGSWKSMFTVEQYELFEKVYREKMAGSKFEELYKGPVVKL